MIGPKYTTICVLYALFLCSVLCENKYSQAANERKKDDVNFKTLEKPFRMNKLNILWSKAQQRLTETKLKSLYSDLKIQDKAEVDYKRFLVDVGDKEGLKEAELRRKLTDIMTNYGLRGHFEDYNKKMKHDNLHNDVSDYHINKSLFKDKKLNILWQKAETSGFTSEELSALKEEFTHHQEKIDQYYELLDQVENGENSEMFKNVLNEEEVVEANEIPTRADDKNPALTPDFIAKANMIRDKHRDLRDGYDKLIRVASSGPNNREFIEPKVQGLWKMAIEGNFTVDELESLKVELQHYENRLLKLRTLHAEHAGQYNKHYSKVAAAGDKLEPFVEQEQLIKKHARKVEKMHADLTTKILARHNEL